ncbi:MAG TPA: type IV pilus assembly protein PilM [Acidobacteriota bacterium]|nr:type IV pilus assembly protein PilM [Acidobacteriota bacterium]
MGISKKNQLVGLDIGSHSIKVAEIAQGKRGRILKNFGLIGLPPDAIVEGSIKEMGVVSSAIKTLFKNLRVKNKNVATSISGFSVIVKKIALSKRRDSELEATIHEESEQYIPFDINEVNIDFDILNKGSELAEVGGGEGAKKEGSERMEVMLVAAKKDIIEDYVELIHLAGLNPHVLDVDAFALQNAFEISTSEPECSCSLVNVGAEELGINIIRNRGSLFTRDSSYGGMQITKAIMAKFNVGFEEAEKMKLGGVSVDKEKRDLEEIFTSVVSEWVQEIKRALDFVASTYPEETIEKILVSGGSCRIPGFQEYLQLETDIPVEELNPFASLIVDEKHFDINYLRHMAPQAAVAVGLALRAIGDK